ncbi:MAG: hypothetical protein ACH346_04240 [Chthoniobacterales bacterium]
MNTLKQCPFKIGDKIIYCPSEKGKGAEAMTPLSEKLIPGRQYTVSKIQDSCYVVVEGYNHPGGGLYWTEFKPEIEKISYRISTSSS